MKFTVTRAGDNLPAGEGERPFEHEEECFERDDHDARSKSLR